ncbi:efflux RND transporter periplasmic adaptor subunit [Luteolibacter sp. SL250]|uniref:efflux RND transporter periplasmic adaptor subunit n=1 Tax=Luteolibacter sp. SL250 TaxID=2995170 RepID=UPI002270DE32|nr:efflux RND transporter periplasmic adaptor subunit [Luteolibacter sp. SL250]WAC19701.1 efflux RND transporter periplasmic adaptor subunit [Luteolibacter sp. SL250]
MNRSFPEVILSITLFATTLHAGEVVKVRTAKPEAAPAEQPLKATGRTAPGQEAVLYARATGTLSERKVDIGDRVKEGDVLAVISAPEIPHEIEAAKARVEQTEARKELAGLLLERGETLAASNAFSKEDLDERRSGTRTATADLLSARAELGRLEELQRFLVIRAPFDGTITARRVDVGDQIKGDANSGDGWLFRIARLDDLRMILHAPPATALQLKPGGEAEISFADLPGRTFPGKVVRSSGVIDAGSGTMRVELQVPNPDFVLPAGLSGMAGFITKSDFPILMVPSNAVLIRGGVANLAVIEAGKVRFLPVKPGRTLGAKTEILSGLSPEKEVVLSPNALLQDGDAVEVTAMEQVKSSS